MHEILLEFYQEIQQFQGEINDQEDAAKATSAYGGIKIILNFYSQITSAKSIVDSAQSSAISSVDRASSYYFSPQQFLVELRAAVLPDIGMLWGSNFVDKASTSIVKMPQMSRKPSDVQRETLPRNQLLPKSSTSRLRKLRRYPKITERVWRERPCIGA